ncbi:MULTISPECIES: permease [Hydrocarboniphaga]|uniref:Permease n=2 Tax=Gammaproteobacteria TaxID=1236 RepID=I7ZD94_9GAMM|nr:MULTISPECIES: permease [Hydrocarboniphaga]EIT69652.1 hypothetical protein WQQ_32340 [Hydrocarboniphaga effusa AP103]MDZ4080038.1 permease [Hydrocarboniphaga sp.]
MNLLLLSASLFALAAGPVLYVAARRRLGLLAFLDGFVLVAISGLVLLEVLPATLESGGFWALVFLALGALGPTVLENQLHHARRAHVATLALSIAGLVMHSVGDGTALAPQHHGEIHLALALAICVHSIPVGLAVWWLLYPVFGYAVPALSIAAMAAGTVAGYAFADTLGGWLGATGWAWLQALVAGSILHVVFGRPHLERGSNERLTHPLFEGSGNVIAVAALLLLENLHPAEEHAGHGGHAGHADYLHPLVDLVLDSAPALLAAFALTLALAVWNARRSRSPAGRSGWLDLLCGLPSEPLYRRHAASGESLLRGLLQLAAGPQLTLAGLALSLALLGLPMTVLAAGCVLLLSLVTGLVLPRLFRDASQPRFEFAPEPIVGRACDLHDHVSPFTIAAPARAPLRSINPAPPATPSADRLWPFESQLPWLICGLLVATLGLPYLNEGLWLSLPPGLQLALAVGIGALLGATAIGAVPIAAMLLATGAPAGVALGLLVASGAALPRRWPLLRSLHGRRFASVHAACFILGACVIGLLLDRFVAVPSARAHAEPGMLHLICLGLLLLLAVVALLRRGGRELFATLFFPKAL